MTDQKLFQTLDASTLQANLLALLQRTARDKGRIEVTGDDGSCCVMISKEELDSLEQALEILANTHDGQAMHHDVEHFAQVAEQSERSMS